MVHLSISHWKINTSTEVESAMITPTPKHALLEQLNDDVLSLIALELKGYLCAFSTTSHRNRAICLPIMFSECHIPNHFSDNPAFPQPTLWPYFCVLEFYTLSVLSSSQHDISMSFPHMPRLHTVRLLEITGGVTWDVLRAIFSAATLRTLQICSPWTDIEVFDTRQVAAAHIPITRLIYIVPTWRESPFEHLQVEATCLWRILERIRMTIELLIIPSETVQYDLMADSPWPQLQELSIYGPCPISEANLFMPILLALPRLRSLSLKLKQFYNQSPLYICPPGVSHDIDLSHLRSFTISYPRPDDQIFTHLPLELENLSLRDSPRHYFAIDRNVDTYRFSARILTATELHGILSTIHLTQLRGLEVVYKVDVSDEKILSHITRSYPYLVSLEIHRYPKEKEAVSITDIAIALSPLKNLHKLRLNLCFPNAPHPRNPAVDSSSFEAMLKRHALHLAETLSPQLQEIGFLQRKAGYNFWLTWHIGHDRFGKIRLIGCNSMYRFQDEESPTVIWRR